MAPTVTLRPGAKPRRPICTGFALQTELIMSGQTLRTEKKFIPATKATASARDTTHCSLKSSIGTMGCFVPFHSQIIQAVIRVDSIRIVQST